MKIALIGYGKMGKMVEKAAIEKGHVIIKIIDSSLAFNTRAINDLSEADVCIDFTTPTQVLKIVSTLANLGKNIVIGTTGWEEHLNEVKNIGYTKNIGILHDSNFSIGMHLFIKILQEASEKILPTGSYDIAGVESHHKQKLDTPSGTAKSITKAICKTMKTDIQIPFTSVRCGSIPGTHTILFDSPFDTITLTHTARSREGFANGAIQAAEWLQGKKGFYTLSDIYS